MIYSSLDSSHRDESNDSKIIPIGAIFAEIAIFAKFRVGSGRVNCLTRPDISGRFGSGTRITGQNSELYLHLRWRIIALRDCDNLLFKKGKSFIKDRAPNFDPWSGYPTRTDPKFCKNCYLGEYRSDRNDFTIIGFVLMRRIQWAIDH